MPSKHWKTQRIVGRLVGLFTWLGIVCCVATNWRRSRHSAKRYTSKQSTMMKLKAITRVYLLDEHRGSQKHGISEKTKPPLYPSLLFIRGDHLFMSKALVIQD